MGGERESVTEQKTKKKNKQSGDASFETIGKVRFHESGGQIHFHDDKKNLKVAVPTGVWSNAWESLSSGQRKKFKFVDVINKSRLLITIEASGGRYEALIQIKSAVFSQEFSSLQNFTRM